MLNIRTILFPTDFSDCSKQALAHALTLAELHDAQLHLLHAVVLHDADPANPEARFPGATDLLSTMFEIADSRLGSMAELHRDRPIEIQEFCVRGVSAADLINEHAREHDVDLIVMGTHGRRGPARFFLGSVASEVLRSSHPPVMTLRELPEGRPLSAVERILVPIDFSDHSVLALAHATELARVFHAEVVLLHVFERPSYPYTFAPVPVIPAIQEIEGLRERAIEGLEGLIERAGDPELRYRTELIEGHAATEIVDFGRDRNCDLIVAATHGLNALERLIIGSTCEQIVRRSELPVFLVKPFGKSLVEVPPERLSASG